MDWGSKQSGEGPRNYQDFMGPGMFAPFAEVLLDVLGVQTGDRVLDVACGTGIVSRAVAARVGAEGSVTGVDLGEAMLEVARSEPAPDGGAAIDFRQGSADELPVEDESFDVATCQQGLQFFPDKPAAVAEIHRALVPGGRVGIATWVELDRNPVMQLIARSLSEELAEEVGEQMHSPFSFHDPDELRSLLEGAGFGDVTVEERTLDTTYPSHERAGRTIVLGGPIAPAFLEASEEAQNAFERSVTEALSEYATDDGGLRAPMTTLEALGTRPTTG